MPQAQLDKLPVRYQKDQLSAYVNLWLDRSQAVALVIAPVAGLLIAGEHAAVRIFNVMALLAALAVLLSTLLPKSETTYGHA